MMKKLVLSFVAAFAALSLLVPELVQAQAPKPLARGTVKKPHKPTNEARWTSMLNSMAVLNQEGAEVRRIDPAEHKQIADTIAKIRGQIQAAKAGGISEAEEDAIDNAIADEMLKISAFMSDQQRKARPLAPAKK